MKIELSEAEALYLRYSVAGDVRWSEIEKLCRR